MLFPSGATVFSTHLAKEFRRLSPAETEHNPLAGCDSNSFFFKGGIYTVRDQPGRGWRFQQARSQQLPPERLIFIVGWKWWHEAAALPTIPVLSPMSTVGVREPHCGRAVLMCESGWTCEVRPADACKARASADRKPQHSDVGDGGNRSSSAVNYSS